MEGRGVNGLRCVRGEEIREEFRFFDAALTENEGVMKPSRCYRAIFF